MNSKNIWLFIFAIFIINISLVFGLYLVFKRNNKLYNNEDLDIQVNNKKNIRTTNKSKYHIFNNTINDNIFIHESEKHKKIMENIEIINKSLEELDKNKSFAEISKSFKSIVKSHKELKKYFGNENKQDEEFEEIVKHMDIFSKAIDNFENSNPFNIIKIGIAFKDIIKVYMYFSSLKKEEDK